MNQKRRLAVPGEGEADEVRYVALAREHEARLRLADVIHGKAQMPLGPDARRRVNERLVVDQGYEMAHAGVGDGGLDQAERRDIDRLWRHSGLNLSRLSRYRASISPCLANHFLLGSQSSGKLVEMFYEPRLSLCRRKRAQMRQCLDERGTEAARLAKKAPRLVARKPGETSCLIEG